MCNLPSPSSYYYSLHYEMKKCYVRRSTNIMVIRSINEFNCCKQDRTSVQLHCSLSKYHCCTLYSHFYFQTSKNGHVRNQINNTIQRIYTFPTCDRVGKLVLVLLQGLGGCFVQHTKVQGHFFGLVVQ